jgi:hypothetical protein
MANITQINVRIFTVKIEDAGTKDPVYLGLGGREFRLSSPENPNLSSGDFTFHFGSDHNVRNPELNDPRKPILTTEDLDKYPVYIAKPGNLSDEDDDAWLLERVDIIINPGPNQQLLSRLAGVGGSEGSIWLRNESGHVLYIKA